MSVKHKQDLLTSDSTPIIYKLWKKLNIDDSTIKENIININPAVGNQGVNLNQPTDVPFHFSDSTKFLNLASNQSGFRVKIRFRTKLVAGGAVANNNVANITLANSWFGHLWNSVKISLGGTEIENINNFGTVFETLSHLRGYEYRNSSGIIETFCPDSGTGDTANTNKGRK